MATDLLTDERWIQDAKDYARVVRLMRGPRDNGYTEAFILPKAEFLGGLEEDGVREMRERVKANRKAANERFERGE
jgi:hypothetical protein